MAEFTTLAELSHDEGAAANRLSLPFLVAGALLMGAGLFLLAIFIVSFNLTYMAGAIPLALGFLLMFHPWAGSNRAD